MTMPVMYRGLRGGAWDFNDARRVRAVFRNWYDVTLRSDYVGFRLKQRT